MSTTLTQTSYTPEDLLKITDRPMPELVDGELVEREMGEEAEEIAATILGMLWAFTQTRGLGRVRGAQCGYQIFPDKPNKVRIPDVSFIRKDRLPQGGPAKGHSRTVPDLVVEVVSPNDLAWEVEAKIEDFLSVGVPLVLVVFPETQVIRLHRPDRQDRSFAVGDTLEIGDIIPGFSCRVADIFA